MKQGTLLGIPSFVFLSCVATSLLLAGFTAHANDDERAEMQRRLNEEVLSSPFDPGDVKKADAWAKEAMSKNLKPVKVAPSYWKPGWTCANLIRYRYYRYRDYRNCVYYNRYYGRYW